MIHLFAKIDATCTGFESNRQRQDYGDVAERICEEWMCMETLYLGDGGYSRLIIDTTDAQEVDVLRPSWNSTERCFEAWRKYGEQFIKEFKKIEEVEND